MFAAIQAIIFAFLAVYSSAATEKNPNNLNIKVTTCYGLVIDAGSGGSRMHVFNWEPRIFDTIPPPLTFPSSAEAWTARMAPGIATLTTESAVHGHLAPLVDFARTTLAATDVDISNVPIFFKATGGMRELPVDQREKIMQHVRSALGNKVFSPFYFHSEFARVISGEEEAIFSWAAVNFLFGTLLPPKDGPPHFGPVVPSNSTFGTVDLGGASTQIAFFVPSQDISEGLFKLQFGGSMHWNVYTKSFLQFGHQSARVRHVNGLAEQKLSSMAKLPKSAVKYNNTARDPCFFAGYSETVQPGAHATASVVLTGPPVATDNHFETCMDSVRPLLVKYNNNYCNIVYNGQCSINGAYQPSVNDADSNLHTRHFIGTSSYLFPWMILGLNTTASLDEYAVKAQHVCSLDWSGVQAYAAQHNLLAMALAPQDYCFLVSYVYLLLIEGYGFRTNQTFTVLDVINGNTVGWALGAMMYEINTMPWALAAPPSQWFKFFVIALSGLLGGAFVSCFCIQEHRSADLHDAHAGHQVHGGHSHPSDHPSGHPHTDLHPAAASHAAGRQPFQMESGETPPSGDWGTKISQFNPFGEKAGGYSRIPETTHK